MEKYLNMSIKEVITAFPKVNEVEDAYGKEVIEKCEEFVEELERKTEG